MTLLCHFPPNHHERGFRLADVAQHENPFPLINHVLKSTQTILLFSLLTACTEKKEQDSASTDPQVIGPPVRMTLAILMTPATPVIPTPAMKSLRIWRLLVIGLTIGALII